MSQNPDKTSSEQNETLPHHQQTEKYGDGHIEARHGRINVWLIIVYIVMFVWALYYGFTYWGGLGPGLSY